MKFVNLSWDYCYIIYSIWIKWQIINQMKEENIKFKNPWKKKMILNYFKGTHDSSNLNWGKVKNFIHILKTHSGEYNRR